MTRPPPSLAVDADAPDTPPPALPAAGWVVGAGARAPASRPAPAARRAARLEARLAVYAQHAATVAEQAASTLAGDLVRADELARAREAAAEHFGELQAWVPTSGVPAERAAPTEPAPSFGALLADALSELQHQAVVDLALQQRLVALRDAVSRGAAWAGSQVGVAALPAPDDDAATAVPEEDAVGSAPVRALERGWVAARADGVGYALGGQFPGLVARNEAAAALTAAEHAAGHAADVGGGAAGSGEAGHVDLRF